MILSPDILATIVIGASLFDLQYVNTGIRFQPNTLLQTKKIQC